MPEFDLPRRLAAEALGTALLVATVVGSGIMAETLTKDVALALLGNTLPTGAILVVLITILGPISGAHFNPAVSLVFALKRELTMLYVAAQIAGGIVGTVMAHAMFALPLLDASLKARTGGAQWLAEGIAAFGLVATILAGIRVATVTTIGTATIAAAIGGGGLGVFIFRGVASVDSTQILAGAVPALRTKVASVASGLLAIDQ